MAEAVLAGSTVRASASRVRRRGHAGPGRWLVLWLCGVLLAMQGSGALAAKDAAESERELQQLRERIQTVKQDIAGIRGQRDEHQAALERTEKEIGSVAAALHRLEAQSDQARDRLQELGRRRDAERENLQAVRATLAAELQAAYMTGRQERIKLLLNQEEPAFLGRMLVYHGYLTRARAMRMAEIRAALARLDGIERELQVQQAEIDRLQAMQRDKSAQLTAEQDRRREILRRLQADLKEKSSELTQLEQNERRLQELVQSLRQALSDFPVPGGRYGSLRELKGKLRWPVAGRIDARYGTKQASGKVSSRGVHIASAAGSDVYAIARGRVVFADWLRGFGLLLIIDHGDGYMSLYGHNGSLYKDVGDRVDGGDIIAAVGSSGGRLTAGLYLELRRNGKPFDPAAWFKGEPVPLQASR